MIPMDVRRQVVAQAIERIESEQRERGLQSWDERLNRFLGEAYPTPSAQDS